MTHGTSRRTTLTDMTNNNPDKSVMGDGAESHLPITDSCQESSGKSYPENAHESYVRGNMLEIKPIAVFRSPFTSKFGIPRQSGIADEIEGDIILLPPYDRPEATRGIEGFTHLWVIWGFSGNRTPSTGKNEAPSLTVRPPRLGGNERVGVFASRSPFRPNGLGLSCVRLRSACDGVLTIAGADMMDGTPIYDLKPYVAYGDCHPEAVCGFADNVEWKRLEVRFAEHHRKLFTPSQAEAILAALREDPRPQYHRDPERVYGMPFAGYDIRFKVNGNIAVITDIIKEKNM